MAYLIIQLFYLQTGTRLASNNLHGIPVLSCSIGDWTTIACDKHIQVTETWYSITVLP